MAYYQYNIICTREEPRVMTPLISKVKIIPMQELGGQRGEGASLFLGEYSISSTFPTIVQLKFYDL